VPGAVLATAAVTLGWGLLVLTGSVSTIWPMFGIANQLLAAVALCLITTWLINSGKAKYAPVTLLPMLWVTTTTMTAGTQMLTGSFPALIRSPEPGDALTGYLSIAFAILVMTLVAFV